MALPLRPNNKQPIPNNPFYTAEQPFINGAYFPVVAGAGTVITLSGPIPTIGVAGGVGSVTSVGTGAGLTGGPITSTGTISLAPSGVTSGSYTSVDLTVDTYGRITAISDGSGGTVTSIVAGTGLDGGTITTSGTIDLADTAVSAGSYTYASITVDQQGRLTAASDGSAPVTAVTGTSPVAITGGPSTPNVTIAASSTTGAGVVQLNNTLSSTSTTEALTAAQGKVLQTQIDTLAITSNLTLAGTLDTVTGNLVTVTAEGTAQGFVIGSPLPAAATANSEFFVIVTVASTSYTPPGGTATQTHVGDWFLSDGTAWQFLDVGFAPPYASTTDSGVVQLATNAATQTGTDATLAVTPASAAATYIACSAFTAQGELLAGTSAGNFTPLSVGTAGQILSVDLTAPSGLKWIALPPSGVTNVAGTSPISINNTNPAVPIVQINAASTSQAGAVQLNDTVTSTSTVEAATANVVKTTYELAAAAVPCSAFGTIGNILIGSGIGAFTALPVGSTGQFLTVDPACATGVKWSAGCQGTVTSVATGTGLTGGTITGTGTICLADTAVSPGAYTYSSITVDQQGRLTAASDGVTPVLPADFTGTGAILAGTGVGTYSALPVGPDGQTLVANSTCASGLEWVASAPGSVATVTGTAPVTVDNSDPQNLIVGVDSASTTQEGVVQLEDSVTSSSTTLAATANAVKTAYQLADAAVPEASFTAAGDLLVGSGAGTYVALPSGPVNSFLGSDGTGTLQWITQSPGDVNLVSGTSPIVVDNSDTQNPVISVNGASTTAPGVVQLNDSVSSTSSSQAATSYAVKLAYEAATASVQSVTGVTPVQVDLSDPQNPDISVDAASTTAPGVVQLNDTVISTSTTEAATANAVKTAYDAALDSVQSVTGTAPIQIDVTDPQNPDISVDAASTTAAGVVQLNDTVSSTSTTQAATANAVKTAYDAALDSVQSVTGTAPVQVDLTDPQNPDISVDAATTAAPGIVQLNSNTNSSSTTEAATPSAVKAAYELADAAIPDLTITAKGDLIIGTGPSAYTALPVGANDAILIADSSCLEGVKWGSIGNPVLSVTGTAPIAVNNVSPTNPVIAVCAATATSLGVVFPGSNINITGGGEISVCYASTTVAGVVQLNDTVASTLTTEAATANAVRQAYDAAVASVQTVTGTSPIQVDSSDPQNPDVSVNAASTTAPGVVQLNDTVSSTSTTQAATANAVKQAYEAAANAVQSVTGTAPVQVDLTDPQNPDVSVDAASTTAAGVVQLDDTVISTSTTLGATANAVRQAYDAAVASVQSVTGTGPIQVDLSDPQNPDVSVDAASTTAAGVVQLNDTTSSTSTTEAATANALTTTYNVAAAAIPCSVVTAKGDIVVATAAGSPTALPVGSGGQVLAVNSLCSAGLEWVTPCNGTVTSVGTGTGLAGGTITGTGTICLADTAVSVGSYTYASITVDQQGRLTAASSGVTPVTAVTGTGPIQVTAGTTPGVSIDSASTTGSGAVQLTNALNNTSQTLALTACAGACLQSQITALATTPGIEFAGTIDANTGLVDSVTSVGAAAGYTSAAVLPAADATTVNTYVIVTTPGTFTPPGGVATAANDGDWFLASETSPGVYSWQHLSVGFTPTYATTTAEGVVCLSTDALTCAGTDTQTAITPASGAAAYIFKSCVTGKGAILTGTAAGTPAALPVGTDGKALIANSACPCGLEWVTPNPGTVTSITAGTGLTGGTISSSGTIALANTAVTAGSYTYGSFTVDAQGRLTAASNGAAPIPCSIVTAKGDIIAATGSGAPTRLPVGTNGQALLACSTAPAGVCWGTPAAPAATPTVMGSIVGSTPSDGKLNTALGFLALNTTLTGCRNVAIGWLALNAATTAEFNTAAGIGAGIGVTSGIRNALFGAGAGGNLTTGSCNVFIGPSTAGNATTGSCNVVIGPGVQLASITGDCQLAIGFTSSRNWLTGDSTQAIRPAAGIVDCAGSCGTAGQVLMSNGANAVCWGNAGGGGGGTVTSVVAGTGLTGGTITSTGTIALDTACVIQPSALTAKGAIISASAASTPSVLPVGTDGQLLVACSAATTGLCWTTISVSPATPTSSGTLVGWNSTTVNAWHTALGCFALNTTVTGVRNTAVGYYALCAVTTGQDNTAVGVTALCSVTGGGANVAIGNFAGRCLTTSFNNVFLGNSAGQNVTTGGSNTLIGSSAGFNITTGNNNIAIGTTGALSTGCCNVAIGTNVPNGTLNNQLAIGWNASCCWLTGTSTKAIKPAAGIIDCANSCGTAGQVLMSNGANAVCWGGGVTGTYQIGTSTLVICNGIITAIGGGGG